MNTPKINVPLGRVVITPGAIEALKLPGPVLIGPAFEYLERHRRGDWGDLDPADKAANNVALKDGSRLMSSYRIDPNKPRNLANSVWIITEWDRSVTTLLLPSEY